MAGIFSQTGSGNPRIAARTNLLPLVFMLAGVEMLVLGFGGRRLRSVHRPGSVGDSHLAWHSKHLVIRALLGLYALIAVLALNLSAITVGERLWSSLDDAEKVKSDFSDAFSVIDAVREKTPKDACILIQTKLPLKYLINYELYPRRFYFHSNLNLIDSGISTEWMNDHHIDWILDITDDQPLRFSLSRRKEME